MYKSACSRVPSLKTGVPRAVTQMVTYLYDAYGNRIERDFWNGTTTTIAFTRCPFRELAGAFPELVCHLHRGIVEGVVEGVPNSEIVVGAFATLADRDPCRVELLSR